MTDENDKIALRTALAEERRTSATLQDIVNDMHEATGGPGLRKKASPKPDLLSELVTAHDNLCDARKAYQGALDAVRTAYPQLTIHVDGEGDVEPDAPHETNLPEQQKPERIGDVMADGYIAAGIVNNEWVLAAPARERYTATWGAAIERSTLPDIDQLTLIAENRDVIDNADNSDGPMLGAIGRGEGGESGSRLAWTSTENSSYSARLVRLSDGYQSYYHKGYERWVVPVRAVEVAA